MKKKLFFVIFTAIFSAAFFSCNDLFTNPQSGGTNLLRNPSFEMNGKPSLAYWQSMSNLVGFSNDTPTPFVKWSAKLNTYCCTCLYPIPVGIPLYQTVKLHAGKKIYTLSFWAKQDSSFGGTGNIVHNNSSKSITINSSMWKHYEIIDTVLAKNYDSLRVEFWGGCRDGYKSDLLVDLCSLSAR